MKMILRSLIGFQGKGKVLLSTIRRILLQNLAHLQGKKRKEKLSTLKSTFLKKSFTRMKQIQITSQNTKAKTLKFFQKLPNPKPSKTIKLVPPSAPLTTSKTKKARKGYSINTAKVLIQFLKSSREQASRISKKVCRSSAISR